MKKIIVFSDSHGEMNDFRWLAEQIIREYGPLDGFIHCGDGARDFEQLRNWLLKDNPQAELWQVSGNCDFAPSLPNWTVIEQENVRILITHGHRFHVKSDLNLLDQFAEKQGCVLTLYGHTHIANWEMRSTLLVNPGSVRQGRAALLTLNDGQFDAKLLEY